MALRHDRHRMLEILRCATEDVARELTGLTSTPRK
jgi:hypothetical protein